MGLPVVSQTSHQSRKQASGELRRTASLTRHQSFLFFFSVCFHRLRLRQFRQVFGSSGLKEAEAEEEVDDADDIDDDDWFTRSFMFVMEIANHLASVRSDASFFQRITQTRNAVIYSCYIWFGVGMWRSCLTQRLLFLSFFLSFSHLYHHPLFFGFEINLL